MPSGENVGELCSMESVDTIPWAKIVAVIPGGFCPKYGSANDVLDWFWAFDKTDMTRPPDKIIMSFMTLIYLVTAAYDDEPENKYPEILYNKSAVYGFITPLKKKRFQAGVVLNMHNNNDSW